MSKILIVSGATGGIGSAICRKILTPDILIPIYRNVDKWKSLQVTLAVQSIACVYEELPVVLGQLDINSFQMVTDVILILTAFDILPIKRIEHLNGIEVENNLKTNILMNISIIMEVLDFVKQKSLSLRIINLNSGAANKAIEGWSLYSASKAYMNMWLRSIQEEEGIRVVSFDPGVVDTFMQEQIRKTDNKEFGQVRQFIQYKEDGKLNDPDDVAEYIYQGYIENWKAREFTEKYVKE